MLRSSIALHALQRLLAFVLLPPDCVFVLNQCCISALSFNSTCIYFCNFLRNIHFLYYLHDFLPLFWQEPPAWDKSHKGAVVRGGAGLQRGDRGVNQQESLQELKQRFMARLQQVGDPSKPLDFIHQQWSAFHWICSIEAFLLCLEHAVPVLQLGRHFMMA